MWEDKAVKGMLYDPRGDQLHVRPARGYSIFIDTHNKITRNISHILRWSLIYDLRTKQWYLHNITSDQRMDIKTFCLKKDTPYDPTKYEKYNEAN